MKRQAVIGLDNPSYRIDQLEVFNWGPFAGLHRVDFDPAGSAIIGQTGSGKTTLVDAIMTLIAQRPLYNLASTGGHESDRDIISYVRGVAGSGTEDSDHHIVRPGQTITALSIRLRSDRPGNAALVRLAGLFWIDGSSSAAADLKRAWLFSRQDEPGIAELLELHRSGGLKGLKQLGRDHDDIKVFDNKKAYLAQVRRFFEVGDNAFELLNRAAGLKQLNSIDDLFRQLVLDDNAMFQRALEVANEFEALKAIHSELETARAQRNSLLPIEREHNTYQNHLRQHERLQSLQQTLPVWFAQHAYRLWQEREQDTQSQVERHQQHASELAIRLQQGQAHAEQLQSQYMQAGGGSIQQLEQQINQQQEILAHRQRGADDYRRILQRLDLDTTLSAAAFADNRSRTGERRATQQQAFDAADQDALAKGALCHQTQTRALEQEQEVEQIRVRPDSNIPAEFHLFKQALAQALEIEIAELAFVAELVEVKPEQTRWRGAIERALGSHRLRLLVPDSHIKTALRWVNQRHNRLHVRLMEATETGTTAEFFDDGFVRKLNFKPHPLRQALKQFLAGIDRHCVDHPEDLQTLAYAMTDQGLMSGRRGFFDKQDQKALHQDWMTGFDNKDRLAALTEALQLTRDELQQQQQVFEAARQRRNHCEQNLRLLDELERLEFNDIDIDSAQRRLADLQQELTTLNDPDSDMAQARQRWQEAQAQLDLLRQEDRTNNTELSRWQERHLQAQNQKANAFQRIGKGLTDAQQQLADNYFRSPQTEQREQLNDHERNASAALQGEIGKIQNKLATSRTELGKLMVKAKNVDTGALAEAGTELEDIPAYLERLTLLTREALPEKLDRFLAYLNQSSDQGVTQLLTSIDNEVNIIEERIADLNRTMRQVDFQAGRYLRLEPRRVMHESLRSLQQAQKELRSAALKDDAGESHYHALMHLVALLREAADKRKTLGARALLDPRYRLQFSVSLIERQSDSVIETRTGSQGGSGGEKEIIASYILTASLSYALCPPGASCPLFATIVLDEAFSKSSMAVAARIISALREFGLHPLFITPNKEMRLLRSHTRSAILVHRKGSQARTTSLSWEQLDEQAQQVLQKVKAEWAHQIVTDNHEIPR